MVLIGGLSIGLFGSWVLSGVGDFDLFVLGGYCAGVSVVGSVWSGWLLCVCGLCRCELY